VERRGAAPGGPERRLGDFGRTKSGIPIFVEGLNSLLDHRATIYLPELDRSYTCHPSFRLFACQNPVLQGGGRKGLPQSFLNRFTQVG